MMFPAYFSSLFIRMNTVTFHTPLASEIRTGRWILSGIAPHDKRDSHSKVARRVPPRACARHSTYVFLIAAHIGSLLTRSVRVSTRIKKPVSVTATQAF